MKELTDTIKAVQYFSDTLAVDGIAGPKTWAWIAWKLGINGAAGASADDVATVGVDARSEQNIATLLPFVQQAARAFLRAANNTLRVKFTSDLTIKIIGGTRSYEEQNALYAIGRTRPDDDGKWQAVTNARGGYSNHNFGIAFDIGVFGPDGHYYPDHTAYDLAGQIGKSLGLAWGGDWESFPDQPHFELRPDWASDLSEPDMMVELRRRSTRGEAAA